MLVVYVTLGYREIGFIFSFVGYFVLKAEEII